MFFWMYTFSKEMRFKKNILKILAVAFFGLFIGFMGRADGSSSPVQEKDRKDISQLSYDIEVVINNVEVIVTDKKGKRVTGLKPENFAIYEDGVLQELTNFYEVKSLQVFGSALDKKTGVQKEEPVPLLEGAREVKNRIILFFDNWHLHPRNRNWITEKLAAFIQKNFAAEKSNQGMVVLLDRRLEIVQDFTPYSHELLHAVERIKSRTGETISRLKEREDLSRELNRIAMESSGTAGRFEQFQRSLDYARNFAEAEMNTLNFVLKSLDAFVDYLSGIEGRKILIYVCDGLPVNPGDEIFSFIDQTYHVGNARTEAMNYDATHLYKELTARCNAREISIYPINAEAFESGFDSADREKSWTTWSRGTSIFRSNLTSKREALKIMAEETGGNAVLSAGGISKGLQTIEKDLRYFYSLGYKSSSRADGKYHPIDVKLVGIDEPHNLRIRKGYIKTSPSEKIKENVLARLFIPDTENPLGIKIQVLPVEKLVSGKFKLTVKLLIPLEKIALLPQKREYVGRIKVAVAFLDSRNFWSDPYELTQDINIPDKDYEKARKQFFPYLAELHLQPERYIISLAVTDVLGQMTSYLQLQKDLSN
jgi:VWFA-related protein